MNTSAFRVVKPLAVTDAILASINVPEMDYPEYSSGTTYAFGARVIRSATHKIYESIAGSNIGNLPETSPTWWIEVSPTNAWRMFDTSTTTQTAQATSISMTLRPGVICNSLAALNVSGCTSLRVRVIDATYGTLYDKTVDLLPLPDTSDWYAWFFGVRPEKKQAVLFDIPHILSADLHIDFTGGADLAVGVLLIGSVVRFGYGVQYGVRVGIQSYSRKETNDFGDVVLVKRANAKRARFDIVLDAREVDAVQTLLAQLDAVPCLWVADNRFEATTLFGWFKDFEILISYPTISDCTLEIEGLT